jgi:hypothetical protein
MGDNAGPPPGRGQLPLDIEAGVAVVSAHWQAYRAIFPAAATIQGSSFEDFWLALNTSTARSSLPVWSGESGDTWVRAVKLHFQFICLHLSGWKTIGLQQSCSYPDAAECKSNARSTVLHPTLSSSLHYG